MDNLRFEIIRLSPEQVRENIPRDHFPDRNKLALKYEFELFLIAEGFVRFPKVTGVPLPLFISYFKDGYPDDPIDSDGRPYIDVRLERNNTQSRQAKRNCRFQRPSSLWSSEISLAGGLVMTSVLFGDYNSDGRTDFLVRLSDGGAIVLQQAGDALPPTVCRPRPQPPAPPKRP